MLISNFNLNKPEWLELVFAKRNKDYGAYYIRTHYNENLNKAMVITFTIVTALSITASMAMRHKPEILVKDTPVDLTHLIKPPKDPIHEAKIEPAKAPPKAPPVNTIANLPPVVTATPPPVEPPSLAELAVSHVGTETIKGTGGEVVPIIIDGPGGEGTAPKVDNNEPVDIGGVDVMPEPVGGTAAWTKFLQKNLRYPSEAAERGISGKVYVTFIIEKNGSLSSIAIARGMGYGLDDEAMRVLKKALPWKPGLQHGQPVRVKYTLPLNFVLDNQ